MAMAELHDWTRDPRPLSACLKDFGRRLNRGAVKGAREAGRAALGIESEGTFRNLLDGKPTPYENTIRLAMVEADRRLQPQ